MILNCFIFISAIASSSLDSSLRLWDMNSGEQLASIDTGPVDIWTVVFSPDDKHVISGSNGGKITMYGVETAKEEQTLDTRGKFILSIAYVRFFISYFYSCIFNNMKNIRNYCCFLFLES